MKRLLTTTTILAALAMPAYAQGQSAGTDAARSTLQMQGMDFMATNLIGKRLYMQGMGGTADGQLDETMNSQGLAGNQASDMAEAGDVDSAIENDLEAAGQDIAQAADTVGEAIETAGTEIAGEIPEVPDTWNRVAEINDLVITADGDLRALIVDAGGFLGIGETERRIDMDNIRILRDSDDAGEFYVVFTGDRALFEQQSAYDPTEAEARGEMRASQDPATQDQLMGAENAAQPVPVDWASVTTEDLLGVAVYGSNDNWIGDLSELVLAEDGKIDGAVIDVGGFLGLGEKPVMLPLDQIKLQRVRGDEIRAYVAATEDELDAMESWSSEDM